VARESSSPSSSKKDTLEPELLEAKKSVRAGKLSWKEQRELEGMEDTILSTETKLLETEKLFSEPDFYAKNGHRSLELEAQCEALRGEIAALYARWEELEARQAASLEKST
jgi:ATP-binding cassette subfamily F protein uup